MDEAEQRGGVPVLVPQFYRVLKTAKPEPGTAAGSGKNFVSFEIFLDAAPPCCVYANVRANLYP